MKLKDKYSLKASIYDRYNDDVLDFLTLYIDFMYDVYKQEGKKPPKHAEGMFAAAGIQCAERRYRFKFPSLAKIKADFENCLTTLTLRRLE